MASQKIGEMNGWYGWLFKMSLWAFPASIVFVLSAFWKHEQDISDLRLQVQVEVERNKEFRDSKDQFTKLDASDLVLAINENKSGIKGISEDILEIRSIVKEIQSELRKR